MSIINKKNSIYISAILYAILSTQSISFAEETSSTTDANNPLSQMKAFSTHNYYIGDLTGLDNNANQTWFRFAAPFSLGNTDWVLRASLPMNVTPTGDGHEFGLSDLNLLFAYLIDVGVSGISLGVGPTFTLPTASDDSLGWEKWTAGVSQAFFDTRSPKFQYGYLLTWQHSFAGNNERNNVDLGTFQPFLFYQLSQGYYLRSSATMSYDLESDNYNIPIGLGIGKVIQTDYAVFNAFIEPQYSVASRGVGQAEWQVFAGLNIQF
ncbi:MAG: hypothetical protein ACK5MJ_04515 [Alphaproteobacteria bacterium]